MKDNTNNIILAFTLILFAYLIFTIIFNLQTIEHYGNIPVLEAIHSENYSESVDIPKSKIPISDPGTVGFVITDDQTESISKRLCPPIISTL